MRSFMKVISVLFIALMAVKVFFPNLSTGTGIFAFVAALVLLAVWAFTALRCFRKEAVVPTEREIEILSLVTFAVLLIGGNFSTSLGIAAFVIEAVAAGFVAVGLIQDIRHRRGTK